ncbi:MAG: DUF4383 domain-containing protein [Gaiellaceae bacterium]
MTEPTSMQRIAALAGVAFLLFGIVGFVPGITIHYGDLRLAGRGSGALLLGVFQVSVLHNLLHVAFGIAGLVLAKTARGARAYLVGGGAACILLSIAGVLGAAGWLPANAADDWLHLVVGAGLAGLGLVAGRAPARAAASNASESRASPP